MAGPCVIDTPSIELLVTGSPGELSANVRNPASSGSATQGDDTTHVVTDNDTPHIQTRTFTIDNSAGTDEMKGIITVALNPIWAGLPDGPISLLWEASLTVDGSASDQRDTVTQALVANEVVQFCPGVLVGQFVVPAGGSINVTWEKRITNDGASATWSFRMGGDKAVWTESF